MSALVMGASSAALTAFADESETEILSESFDEVQVEGDDVLHADDACIDDSEDLIQIEEDDFYNSSSDDYDPVLIYSDVDGDVMETEEKTAAVSDSNTETGVLAQSEAAPSSVVDTAAYMLLTEKESDKDGFKGINVCASAKSNSSTEFRIYFWVYDGSLPLNPDDWNDYCILNLRLKQARQWMQIFMLRCKVTTPMMLM